MTQNASEKHVSVLLLGEYDNERPLVDEVSRKSGWRLFEARTRRLALQCLQRNPVQVVITESELPNWNWKSVLRDLRQMAAPPQLVVTSRTADDRLWSEVLNIGGFDVLARPLEPDELCRVVASAFRHFERQPIVTALARPLQAMGAA